jgi:cellulose synthase/poly-beta-1,6-N-acetylglucosamine synthase-like glycosyltransferase
MMEAVWTFVAIVNGLVLGYFVLLNGSYLITSVLAFRALRAYTRRLETFNVNEMAGAASAPPITLLAPSYNEEATCVEAVRSMLSLEYPSYEVLVVNDGSKDATVEILRAAFDLVPTVRYPTAEIPARPVRQVYRSRLYPNLWLVDKENGGKADALNVGVNHCGTPLFCAMDADSLLEREALLRVARPFMEDATTVAAGGIIRIVNGCTVRAGVVTDVRMPRNGLAQFQVLEYLRAFLFGRVGWDALDTMLIISGAFGLFRRATVVEVGGFATDTVGEDMELVVRLHRHCREQKRPYRITFVPDPVAWTECPESARVLGRQRDRWQRGLAQVLTRHRTMLLNPKYGRIWLVAFPYFYFLEMWGPVLELFGYLVFGISVAFGAVSPLFVVAFLMVAVVLDVALSLSAVALEELAFKRYTRFSDLLRLFGLAIVENFGYRQMVTYWRMKGMWSYLRKVESWGKMERKGFGTPTS